MQISIKLSGALMIKQPKEQTLELPDGSSVQDVLERLQLSEGFSGVVQVNGSVSDKARALNDGDALKLIPLLAGG